METIIAFTAFAVVMATLSLHVVRGIKHISANSRKSNAKMI